jgi:hypothetical protein
MRKTLLSFCLAALAGCYFKTDTHSVDEQPLEGMDAAADSSTDADASTDSGTPDSSNDGGDASLPTACGVCPGDKPVCIANTKQCVTCTATDKGACGADQVCDAIKGECVQCLSNTDCKEANASVCDTQTRTCKGCSESSAAEQCGHIAGKGVCSASECVQCTSEKLSACLSNGTQFVCNASTKACDMNRKARSRRDCSNCVDNQDAVCTATLDCVSNLECQDGQACVAVAAGNGRKVCQVLYSETAACPRPYIDAPFAVDADGKNVRVCSLRNAGTCKAHADYTRQRCGTENPSKPSEDLPSTGDNTKCGETNVDDGICVYSDGLKQHRCTVPCANENNDCPAAEAGPGPSCLTTRCAL